MKEVRLFVLVSLLLSLSVVSILNATNYYSQGNLAPNLTSSWNTNPGGGGSTPANFFSGDTFIIQSGHYMTTTAMWNVIPGGSMVEISNGGTLKAVTSCSANILGRFQIDGGGRYIHAVASGSGSATIPGASGRRFANSTNGGLGNGTFEIAAQNTAGFATTGITWGNVEINNSTQANSITYPSVFANVEGDFSVLDTNNQEFSLTTNQTDAHVIKGSLTISGASSFFSCKNGTGLMSLTVYGDVNLQDGTFSMATTSSGTTELYFRSNLNLSGGLLTESSTSISALYPDGTGPQQFTRTGGTISNDISLYINNGKILDMGTSVFDGSSGSFLVSGGGTLFTAHSQGMSTLPNTGCIQIANKNFVLGASIGYNGTVAQVTGDVPIVAKNLTINNPAGVTMSCNIIIIDSLIITSGSLNLNGYNWSSGGGASLNYNGTSAQTVGAEWPSSISSYVYNYNTAGLYLDGSKALSSPNRFYNYGKLYMGSYQLSGDIINIDYLKADRCDFIASGNLSSGGTAVVELTTGGIVPGIEITMMNLVLSDTNGSYYLGAYNFFRTLDIGSNTFYIGSNSLNIQTNLLRTTGTLVGGFSSNLTIDCPISLVADAIPTQLHLLDYTVGTLSLPYNIELTNLGSTGLGLLLNNKTITYHNQNASVTGSCLIHTLGFTTSVTNTMPSYINRTWDIYHYVDNSPLITTLTWSAADDNNLNWGSIVPAVYTSSKTKFTAISYDVTSNPRSITFAFPAGLEETYYNIGPDTGGTLPVELSSFTATATSQYFVQLNWTTQSETGVSGYYIYRNRSSDLTTAIKIPTFITATNTSSETNYSFVDQEVSNNSTYYYWLQNVDLNNHSDFHGPISVTLMNGSEVIPPVIPAVTELRSIYPNPFNPTAIVSYNMAKAGNVTITVFNVKGEKVRNLVNESKSAGTFQVSWNGNDENGSSCTSGIYYVKMTAGKYTTTQKVVLAK